MDAFLRRVITASFHFIFIATPLFFLFSTDELFEFNKMMLVYGGTLVIVTAWLLRMIFARKLLFQKTPLDIPLVLFFASQLLSTIFSLHPRTSWLGYYSRFHGGLLSTITYLLLYWVFVSTVTKKELKSYFLTILGTSFLVSVYAILEHYGHSISCYLINNGRSFGTDCWIQDVQSRVFATFGQPNWLAAYAIVLLPISMVLSLTEKTKAALAYSVASVALLLTLFFTQSRSGMLGFAVSMAVLAAAILFWHKQLVAQQWRRGLLLAASFAICMAVWGPGRTIIDSLVARQSTTTQTAGDAAPEQAPVNRLDVGGTDSGEIRKIVWSGAIAVGKRYPLFGSGVETFAYSYYLDRPVEHNLVSEWDFLYNKAHNEFLNFFATTGVVGLASYSLLLLWFGAYCARMVLQKLPEEKTSNGLEQRWTTVALLAGVIALSISNFFGFSTVMVSVLLFIWFAIAVVLWDAQVPLNLGATKPALKHHKKARDMQENEAGDMTLSLLLSLVVVAFFLVLLGKWYAYWSADMRYARGKNLFAAGQYQASLQALNDAIAKSPNEALYHDELSIAYAQVATALAEHDATAAGQLAQAAIDASNTAIKLNDVHLNFYKTRSRVFITLAQLDPSLLQYAREALLAALDRAPTDAKLMYNLGLVEIGMDHADSGIEWLQKAVKVKANYGAARVQLADALMLKGEYQNALDQYNYIMSHITPDDQRARAGAASASAQLAKPKE